jgi:hypothetical protein
MIDESFVLYFGALAGKSVKGRSHPEALVRRRGPDTIAIFAIRPAPADTGGYGGSPSRGKTDRI